MSNPTPPLGAPPPVVQPLERAIIGRSSLESLPQELLVSIFSHLSLSGLQASDSLHRDNLIINVLHFLLYKGYVRSVQYSEGVGSKSYFESLEILELSPFSFLERAP